MRINRLLQITVMLVNRKNVTVKKLSEHFNVSKKTIYRDLETLILSGIPICYGDNKEGIITLLEGYSLKYALLPDNKGGAIYDIESIDMAVSSNMDMHFEGYSTAWHSFINHRFIDNRLIKEEILQSWTRCQKNKVPLYESDSNNIVRLEEMNHYTIKNFKHYDQSGYKTFQSIIKKLDLTITIYDGHNQLKYIINGQLDKGETSLTEGYLRDVSEQKIGTNAYALAMIEKKPFIVIGVQHYKKSLHNCSTVAVPLYAGDKIIGTMGRFYTHNSVTLDTLNVIYGLARIFEKLVYKKGEIRNSFHNTKEKSNGILELNDKTIRFNMLWGESKKWLETVAIAKSIASLDSPIVIIGEPGVGKKTIAECIHHESETRKLGPCIIFDCRSIPEELMEIMLFGSDTSKGTLDQDRVGLIEKANGGTLILEHVHVLSKIIQDRLSQFISTGKFRRNGSKKNFKFSVRMIICMNPTDEDKISERLKNEIQGLKLTIPPLRQRKKDIILLCQKKAEEVLRELGYKSYDLRTLNKTLKNLPWNNNVTELFGIVEKLIVITSSSQSRDEIDNKVLQFISQFNKQVES